MFLKKIISSVIFKHMKKFQYFLLFVLYALPINSFAQTFVEFTAQSDAVSCTTNTLSIDIDVQNFIQMDSFDYSFHWDTTTLTLTSIDNPMLIPDIIIDQNGANAGTLTFSWTSNFPAGTTLSGGTMVTLNFDLIGNATQVSDFTFDNTPLSINITQDGMALNSSQYTLTDGLLSIFDTTPPTITCPIGSLTFDTGGATTTLITGASPVATDNCALDFISYELTMNGTNVGVGIGDVSNNVNFEIGTTTVTYTASDFGGNTDICSFDVIVTNSSVPTIMTISMDNSLQVNCEDNTVSFNIYADAFNNIRSSQFIISWPAALQYIGTSNHAITVGNTTFGNPTSGQLDYSWNHNTEISLPNGTILFTIEFNLSSPAGFTIPISFVPGSDQFTNNTSPLDPSEYSMVNGSIFIFDNEVPMITCPADITVNSNGAASTIVDNIELTATDNCSTPTISYVIFGTIPMSGTGDASGNTFLVGITMITYTAIDESGNNVSCDFNVTVIQDPLMIECPMDLNQGTDANVCSATLDLPVTILSDPNNINTILWDITGTSGSASGTGSISNFTFSIGTSNILYTVTDISGITETCSFEVTINDLEAPIIAGIPVDITVECDNTPTAANLTANDQCDGITLVNLISESIVAGPIPGSSIITRTWSTVDAAGNISIANQSITVIDTTTPTITCPADIVINSSASLECGANVTWIIPTASDNCDNDIQVASSSPFSPGDFFPLGTTEITYFAIDDAGNLDSCKFNITVNDIDLPIFIDCPADLTITTGITCDTVVTWLEPTVLDNCNNNLTLVVSPPLGTSFMVGTTTVTYTATDSSGNISTCSFDITVMDLEAPVISGCSGDLTLNSCGEPVSWSVPLATDNCDVNPTLVSNPPNGSLFPIGTTPVTYTATDVNGNISTCSFNVIIEDNEAPSVFCPSDVTISSNGDIIDPNTFNFIDLATTPVGCDSVRVIFNNPTGNDNCGIPTVTSFGMTSGDTLGIGDHLIQFIATDGFGNNNTVLCETTITITPFVELTITATPDAVCTAGSTQLFADPFNPVSDVTYSWTGPNPNRMIPDIANPFLDNLILQDAGTYIVTITDTLTTCTSTDSITIMISQGSELTMLVNTANCVEPDGSTNIPLSVQITNTVTIDSFIWTNPAGIVFSNDQNTFIFNASETAAGLYCVEVFEENGCSNSICDTIQITNIPTVPIIASSCGGFVCIEEACTLTGLSIQDSIIWTATGNAGLPTSINQSEITITPTQDGVNLYTYTTIENGCESSSSIAIIVSSPASVVPDFVPVELNTTKDNFSVIDNDTIIGSLPGIFSINVTSNVSNGFLANNSDGTFNYTPDNGFLGDDQFIYEICLDCDGQEVCQWAIVTLSIETDECIVPTIITPNGDGMNDTWEISCVKNSPNNEVIVFNRWGDEVYRAIPYNNDWEGTYNNEELSDGTYFYIFKTTANDPNPLKGTVNIYR
jgi:gliding motility-associated-like protein